MTRRILIATSNAGKLREIRAVTADLPVAWIVLADLPPMPEAVEDGDTYRANAEKKALHYAALSGLWTLADDSGLEVDALGGAPGVKSARFAGGGGSPANNAKLLADLRGVPLERRAARYVCWVALAEPSRVLAVADGVLEGRIVDEARGQNGFGYDPYFWLPQLSATMAELPPEHKNAISHRGQALRRMAAKLRALLAASPAGG